MATKSDIFEVRQLLAALSPTLNLADVAAGDGGFKTTGEAAGDAAGFSVGDIGDLDGSGRDEAVVGAPFNDAGGADAGAAYVVFGKADGALVNLADVAVGTGGFKIVGEAAGDNAGFSNSSIRDLSGDGLPEVLAGAPFNDARDLDPAHPTGAAYVVFGKSDGAAVDLDDVAAGTGGFKINGESPVDGAGFSVFPMRDLDGDGRDEILVGAPGNNTGGENAGAAYVVFGKAGGEPVNLTDIAAGIGGFKITGEAAGDNAGFEISLGFRVNDDGVEDILVGAPGNSAGGADAGAAYVVFGTAAGDPVNLDDVAAGTGGFKIFGEAAGDEAGFSVNPIQDLNGDQRDEVVVGAPGDNTAGTNAGAAYVVFGKADGAPVDLDQVAAGVGGFKIIGEAAGDQAGLAVAHTFDLNGDGRYEVLLGAPFNDEGATDAGAAYVVFGKADGAPVDLADVAAGIGGFKITGEAENDNAGSDITTFGNQNDNQLGEILVGAVGADNSIGADYALLF